MDRRQFLRCAFGSVALLGCGAPVLAMAPDDQMLSHGRDMFGRIERAIAYEVEHGQGHRLTYVAMHPYTADAIQAYSPHASPLRGMALVRDDLFCGRNEIQLSGLGWHCGGQTPEVFDEEADEESCRVYDSFWRSYYDKLTPEAYREGLSRVTPDEARQCEADHAFRLDILRLPNPYQPAQPTRARPITGSGTDAG